jgi:hypothetical protein
MDSSMINAMIEVFQRDAREAEIASRNKRPR